MLVYHNFVSTPRVMSASFISSCVFAFYNISNLLKLTCESWFLFSANQVTVFLPFRFRLVPWFIFFLMKMVIMLKPTFYNKDWDRFGSHTWKCNRINNNFVTFGKFNRVLHSKYWLATTYFTPWVVNMSLTLMISRKVTSKTKYNCDNADKTKANKKTQFELIIYTEQ